MVFRRGILPVVLALCGLSFEAGCQTSNSAAKSESIAPSFGMDPVPRQSEPELDGVAVARTGAVIEAEPGDDDESDSTPASSENLLTRLIPGRDKGKERAERKALPVSERTAAADDLDGLPDF